MEKSNDDRIPQDTIHPPFLTCYVPSLEVISPQSKKKESGDKYGAENMGHPIRTLY